MTLPLLPPCTGCGRPLRRPGQIAAEHPGAILAVSGRAGTCWACWRRRHSQPPATSGYHRSGPTWAACRSVHCPTSRALHFHTIQPDQGCLIHGGNPS